MAPLIDATLTLQATLIICVLVALLFGAKLLVWDPLCLGRFYRAQGVPGTAFKLLVGDC